MSTNDKDPKLLQRTKQSTKVLKPIWQPPNQKY
jgi:hypothetical protein